MARLLASWAIFTTTADDVMPRPYSVSDMRLLGREQSIVQSAKTSDGRWMCAVISGGRGIT